MEVEAAKLIGAGLATIALAGAGIGIGNIFAKGLDVKSINRRKPKILGAIVGEATHNKCHYLRGEKPHRR